MPNISISTAQFSGGAYQAGESNSRFNKDVVKNATGQEAGSDIKKEDLQSLEKAFAEVDGREGGKKDGLIDTQDLGRSVESGKLDPAAQKAAILLMTNPKLLNKFDGDKDGMISSGSLTQQAGLDEGQNKFTDATKLFSKNSNVLDKWEKNGKENDRFGTAAIAELANDGKVDERTWEDNGLGAISKEDRQKYIDAAKTMWADQDRLKEVAGDDGIINNKNLKDYVKDHTVKDNINA